MKITPAASYQLVGNIFWVDSPKYCSVEKIEYIKATMDRVEKLIMSADKED